MHATIRSIALLTASAIASLSYGIERSGDRDAASELDSIALAVAAIQDDRLSQCETATGARQFELYRQYNHSSGTWQSVDSLRDLVDRAIEAQSALDEARFRTDIADHARFVLWELDEHVHYLIETLSAGSPTADWQVRDEIRVARQAHDVVERLTNEGALR